MEKIKNLIFAGDYKPLAIKGITWMGGLKVFTRAISIIRISILARILNPSQFGLFGIASLILSLLEILTQTGVNVVLVQEKKSIDKYIDTAWIVSIVRGVIIALFVYISAPFVADFFKDREAANLIRVISVVPFLRGFINPSVVKFQKNLKFDKIFKINSTVTLFDTLGSIAFTYLTNSPVGIIFGMITGVLIEILLTFKMARPLPKISFDNKLFRKIIKGGKWVTGFSIINYMTDQGDDAVVGRLLDTTSLGLYQTAYKLSLLPGSEVTGVVSSVTFPIFTDISDDKARMRRAFKKMFVSVNAIVIPMSVIIFLYPSEIIEVFLGDQWLDAAPVLQVLIIFGLVSAINRTKNPVLLALKKQNILFRLHAIRFIVLAILIVPLTLGMGIVGAGIASLISVLIVTPFAFYYLYKSLN